MMGGDRVDDAWRVGLLFLSSSPQWLEEMMGVVVVVMVAAAAAVAAVAAASRPFLGRFLAVNVQIQGQHHETDPIVFVSPTFNTNSFSILLFSETLAPNIKIANPKWAKYMPILFFNLILLSSDKFTSYKIFTIIHVAENTPIKNKIELTENVKDRIILKIKIIPS